MFHQAQFCFYIFSFLFYSPSLSHHGTTHWASFFCRIFSNNRKILETLSLKAKTDHMYSRNTKFLKWAFKLCYYTCWALFFQLGFNILDLIWVGDRGDVFFQIQRPCSWHHQQRVSGALLQAMGLILFSHTIWTRVACLRYSLVNCLT